MTVAKFTLLFFAFSAETKKLEIIWFSIHDQTLVCGIVIHCHDYMILETKKNIYWESLHCKKEDELSHHKHFARKTQFYRYVNQNQDSQFCSQWTYYFQKDKTKINCNHLVYLRDDLNWQWTKYLLSNWPPSPIFVCWIDFALMFYSLDVLKPNS